LRTADHGFWLKNRPKWTLAREKAGNSSENRGFDLICCMFSAHFLTTITVSHGFSPPWAGVNDRGFELDRMDEAFDF
jgi:hypothetical protein